MDFASMLRPVNFDRRPEEAATVPRPILLSAKNRSRKLAALKEASDILAVLPGPGESLHAIMTGRYDVADLLEVLIDKLGHVAEMRIATLAFSTGNARTMKTWADRGIVGRLALLCSSFFYKHNKATYEELRATFAETGTAYRLAHSRNHCKVVCLTFTDGTRYALEGSANLRTNSNREQFSLVRDDALHDWHAGWIDSEVDHAQVNQH